MTCHSRVNPTSPISPNRIASSCGDPNGSLIATGECLRSKLFVLSRVFTLHMEPSEAFACSRHGEWEILQNSS